MVLPLNARPYGRTDTFTEVTVPAALLKAHTTKQGTWALIHVLEGRLAYKIVEPGQPSSNAVLTPTTPPGVIEPSILHEVAPLGRCAFMLNSTDAAKPDRPELRGRPMLGGDLHHRLRPSLSMELLARNGAHFLTSSTLKKPNGIRFVNVGWIGDGTFRDGVGRAAGRYKARKIVRSTPIVGET